MQSPIYSELAQRLVRARKAAGLTQRELAAAVGLSRGSIANIERGKQRIHVDTLYALAQAVAKEPGDLLPRASVVELDGHELAKFPESVRAFIQQIARPGEIRDA